MQNGTILPSRHQAYNKMDAIKREDGGRNDTLMVTALPVYHGTADAVKISHT
jgi:hypothetical protein